MTEDKREHTQKIKKDKRKHTEKIKEDKREHTEKIKEEVRKDSSRDLTRGPIAVKIILFALPLLGSSLIQLMYSSVDLIFVGQFLGTEASASIGASDLLITCMVGFFTGMAVGTNVIAARYFGQRNEEKLKKLIQTIFLAGIAGGIALVAFAEFFAPIFLSWMGTPEEIYGLAIRYLRIYILSMVSVVLYNLLSGVIRAMGDSRTPMLLQLAGGILNIFADYVCIVYLKLGVEGTAIATVVSQTFAALCVIAYLCRMKNSYHLNVFGLEFHPAELKSVLKVGVPSGIQSIIITFSNIIIQSQINTLGVKEIASFTVYFKAENMLWLPLLALGQASVSFVSQNYGAGQWERISKGNRISIFGGAAFTFAEAMLLLLIAPLVVGLFTRDPKVAALTMQEMRTTYPLYFMCTVIEILSSNMRSFGKAVYPMAIVIFSYCGVRVLALFQFMRIFHSVRGVALSYPVSWTCALLLLGIAYYKIMPEKARKLI
ncbi:MAG: MATE family efflux transporter [Eubacterium sp.]|nr:MATE family efflux transporter [Eubacterium sp.]